jgi:hypothetical protein
VHIGRIERRDAADAAEMQLPVGAAPAGAHEIGTIDQAILGVITLGLARDRIDARDAGGRADPDDAVVVFEDRADRLRVLAAERVVTKRRASASLHHPVQAPCGANPQVARPGLEQMVHAAVTQARTVVRIMAKAAERAADGVEALQARFGADPQHAALVLDQGKAIVVTQARGVARHVAPVAHGRGARRDCGQAIARHYPQRAVTALAQRLYMVGARTLAQFDTPHAAVRVAPRQAGRCTDPEPPPNLGQRGDDLARERIGAEAPRRA